MEERLVLPTPLLFLFLSQLANCVFWPSTVKAQGEKGLRGKSAVLVGCVIKTSYIIFRVQYKMKCRVPCSKSMKKMILKVLKYKAFFFFSHNLSLNLSCCFYLLFNINWRKKLKLAWFYSIIFMFCNSSFQSKYKSTLLVCKILWNDNLYLQLEYPCTEQWKWCTKWTQLVFIPLLDTRPFY